MITRNLRLAGIAGTLGLAFALASPTILAREIDPAVYEELPFRHIGPEGNRVIAIAGSPGDRDVIYAGAASGGIWKTTDGGLNWDPVFDDADVASIGALAAHAEADRVQAS